MRKTLLYRDRPLSKMLHRLLARLLVVALLGGARQNRRDRWPQRRQPARGAGPPAAPAAA